MSNLATTKLPTKFVTSGDEAKRHIRVAVLREVREMVEDIPYGEQSDTSDTMIAVLYRIDALIAKEVAS